MMKNFLVITMFGVVAVLGSCTDANKQETDECFVKATEFQYKGHDYIHFKGVDRLSTYYHQVGYVHNPECKKCLEVFD